MRRTYYLERRYSIGRELGNIFDVATYHRDNRSFSQLQTYSQCSEKFRLQRVERVPEDMTAWAPQGNGFHTGAEHWELSGRQLSTEEAVDIAVAEYDRLIAEQWAKQPEPSGWLTGGRTKVDVDIDRRRDRVAKQMRGYIAYSLEHRHEFWPEELPDGRPAVEFPFELEFHGIKVLGAIDLILRWANGSITVRDLKTGNKLPNDPLQLRVYGLAWEKYFGDLIEYGDFYMCKNDFPTKPYLLTEYSEGMIAAWVEMMDRSEKSGIYLPSGGDHCRVCTVSKYCTLMGGDKRTYQMPTMKTQEEMNG